MHRVVEVDMVDIVTMRTMRKMMLMSMKLIVDEHFRDRLGSSRTRMSSPNRLS